jgi:polysaccharide export outer membrane protein
MKHLLALSILVTLAGCSGSLGKLPPLPPEAMAPYVLGVGDTLQIAVFGETDLSGPVRISDSGTIAIPLVGLIPAEGLTVEQLKQRLVKALDAKAVRSPDVTVTISEYRPFFILGEVAKPGSYAYVPNMTVLTAVAIAGGFTLRAEKEAVAITRRGDGKSVDWRATGGARVLPGDVVNVAERHL